MNNKSDEFETMLKKAFREDGSLPIELVHATRENLHKKEVRRMNLKSKKTLKWVASLAAGFMLTSITAFAAWHMLTPSDVASEFGDENLAIAFDSQDANHINETIVSEGYSFSLLSIISGENLSEMPIFINESVQEDRTYAVVAIKREDGTPMNESTSTFFASPYIYGFAPWQVNLASLGGGHQEVIIDGILYRLIDIENLEVFADRGVYLGISLGTFSFEAFDFNEESGMITINQDFDGPSVLFELPFDVSLADEERAQEILDAIFSVESIEGETDFLEPELNEIEFINDMEDSTFVRLTYDELADFLEARIESDIAAGAPQAVIEGARRDRANHLRMMREYNIEFAEVWYNDNSFGIGMTNPNYAE